MKKNRLIIAAAGAGKTTFLVKEALKCNDNVLITTYTEANAEEIKRKIIQLNKAIPGNITVQTWFSFLMQHGVKPYQGSIYGKQINGLCFVNTQSGLRFKDPKGKPVYFSEDKFFERHYFNNDTCIYSDKLSKFVIRSNEKSGGNVMDRISRIYPHILVDEVQDLAGYDLSIIKLLFQTSSEMILVGDPRQVTYLTHHENLLSQYKHGKIELFVLNECAGMCLIDRETLKVSHRNNAEICEFSSKLYPFYPGSEPCACTECRIEDKGHKGIYVVRSVHAKSYITTFNPVILRYRDAELPEWNFGKAKGLGFNRVLIYPSKTFLPYLSNGSLTKVVSGKTLNAFDISKHYVAITRAKLSVGIIHDYKHGDKFIKDVNCYEPEEEG